MDLPTFLRNPFMPPAHPFLFIILYLTYFYYIFSVLLTSFRGQPCFPLPGFSYTKHNTDRLCCEIFCSTFLYIVVSKIITLLHYRKRICEKWSLLECFLNLYVTCINNIVPFSKPWYKHFKIQTHT